MVTATTPWYHDFETGEIVIELAPPLSWSCKGLAAILAKAEEFGVNPFTAISARLRFIAQRHAELERNLWGCERGAERLGTGPNFLLTCSDVSRRLKERIVMEKYEILKKEHTSLSYEKESLTGYSTNPRKSAAKSGKITEAMIEAARNFPIETLFEEAVRGNMVCCPFHEDKSPSASIRHNRLHCFAGCSPKGGQSSWSPISLLMERDGLNFPAAVRRLAA